MQLSGRARARRWPVAILSTLSLSRGQTARRLAHLQVKFHSILVDVTGKQSIQRHEQCGTHTVCDLATLHLLQHTVHAEPPSELIPAARKIEFESAN